MTVVEQRRCLDREKRQRIGQIVLGDMVQTRVEFHGSHKEDLREEPSSFKGTDCSPCAVLAGSTILTQTVQTLTDLAPPCPEF